MRSQIRAILFDKDGTLFDFNATWAAWAGRFLDEVSGYDPARAAALGARIGYDVAEGRFRPDSPVIAGTPAEVAARLEGALPGWSREAIAERIIEASLELPLVPPVPLRPLLGRLRLAGFALGVATNDAEAPARAHLAAAGVAELFDFVAGCDSGHGAKPAPGQILAFAEAVGAAPSEVLMLGDSTHDLAAARAAGARAVGVLTGVAGEATLAPLAEAVLPDIGALPGWLGLP